MLLKWTAPHSIRVSETVGIGRANVCKNRTINPKSKNVDGFKFHRLLNLSSGNSMISTNILFCLVLLSWDFVHSVEVFSQRDKIRERFSFLDQLDSLLKSYKYDNNDIKDFSSPLANTNSVKSDNLLATAKLWNNRLNSPQYNEPHPYDWYLDNTYEDASKTYNYGDDYNGGKSYNMNYNYGLLRKLSSLRRRPLVFSNHLPWQQLLLRSNGFLGYGDNRMRCRGDERPLVEDINNLLYVTETGCEFLATLSKNDPKLSAYTHEIT